MASFRPPKGATHCSKDAMGYMFYKQCEVTGKWLFWCVDCWEYSNSANLPGFELIELKEQK